MQTKGYEAFLPDGFILVKVELSTCTFSKALKDIDAEEIAKVTGLDPKVISKGAKKLADQKTINKFRNSIDTIKNKLGAIGYKMGNDLYAIHKHLATSLNVLEECESEVRKFASAKAFLLNNYAQIIEHHAVSCDNNPKLPQGFGDVVRNQHFPVAYLEEQLQCKVTTKVDMSEILNQSMMDKLASEAHEWLHKIRSNYVDNGVPSLSTGATEKLTLMETKLREYEILDKRMTVIADMITHFKRTITYRLDDKGVETKTYSANTIIDLLALLTKLSNPSLLKTIATQVVAEKAEEKKAREKKVEAESLKKNESDKALEQIFSLF
ncbi:hypothetical protein [Vibrio agarivorans]|uniref:DUF3150 domain-containing protein n=1 Tax=Vibrio agarivorans TaxID=153622 RepID=A0ABT7Y7C0_9VIBR|nr:hypothetical protein [Vibrio agarivorans]MDN2483955.1 hypothetical protein [Vibrio agarivorans]